MAKITFSINSVSSFRLFIRFSINATKYEKSGSGVSFFGNICLSRICTWCLPIIIIQRFTFQAATFQLVLATDGTNSYLMYIYKQNQMNWVQWSSLWTPPILVGFTVKGGQHYKVHPLSFTSLALQMDQYAETNGM